MVFPCPIQHFCPLPNVGIVDDNKHLLNGLAHAFQEFLLFGESNHLNLFDFAASLKLLNYRRMSERKKITPQNKSPSFAVKQRVLLPTTDGFAKKPQLKELRCKVFALSKTVEGLAQATKGPKKDDQLAKTHAKVLEE